MRRDREHLVFAEVEKLMDAAKGSHNAARDRCLLLRISEARGLRLSQVDTDAFLISERRPLRRNTV